jgi:UDP-3-O-[3-hydroxymyristoyl] N-acetylglucosamine deacetylase
MTLRPAPAGQGVLFRRTDDVSGNPIVPALWDRVIVSPLNTRIANDDGVSVSTIEHLMASLAGTGIHNVTIDIDGPEVPIMDGSAADFVRGLVAAGQRHMPATLHAIRILKPVEVTHGDAMARLSPATTLQIDFSIDFPDEAIGHQARVLNLANGAFLRDLASSRTFCRQSDVDAMRAQGLALGGTLDNAVVYDGTRVLTPGGLRHPDEAVRHKMLDALGDLATAGHPILGRYTGVRAGHAMTNRLLRALFATPDAWRLVRVDRAIMARLPGAGVTEADLHAVA